MNVYAIYLISFAGWILTRRAGHQHAVYKHMAKALHGEDEEVLIKATTNSLTDPKQNKWAFFGYGLVALAIYLKWIDTGFLSAFLMLSISLFLTAMYGILILPKPSEPKCAADVLKSLYRRKMEFEKEHDVMRADAINYYIKKVEEKFRIYSD